MSAFGLLPFGTVAPWGGPGLLSIITVVAIGTNELIVFFTAPPRWRDPGGWQDTRNPEYWTITPFDPVNIGLEGEVIVEPGKRRPSPPFPWIGETFRDKDDSTQIHIRTVPSMQPGVEYDLTLAPSVLGKDCEVLAGKRTFRVTGRNRPKGEASRFAVLNTYRDWANPFFLVDPATGQQVVGPGIWQYDEAGEIVLDDAAGSLKKRVYRRIETEVGGFSHLPGYGLRALSKHLARPTEIQNMAVRLQEQIRQEPDVRDVSVSGSVEATTRGGIVRFVINVQAKSIGEVSFLVQVSAGGV